MLNVLNGMVVEWGIGVVIAVDRVRRGGLSADRAGKEGMEEELRWARDPYRHTKSVRPEGHEYGRNDGKFFMRPSAGKGVENAEETGPRSVAPR